jgi:hypothetical protein
MMSLQDIDEHNGVHREPAGLVKMFQSESAVAAPIRPALASIRDACLYLGGLSRSKFYADVLPLLDKVKLGNRNFVVVASMDRLIAARANRPIGDTPPAIKGGSL